jgi:hypothetical protein
MLVNTIKHAIFMPAAGRCEKAPLRQTGQRKRPLEKE